MFADFLAHLHRGGSFAYYHTLPERRSVWYAVDEPPAIAPERARSNLYFSVHPARAIPPCNAHGEVVPPAHVRSQLRFIAAVNCLYAEFDAKDYGSAEAIMAHIDALPVPAPSVLIGSGGGIHAYWLLDAPWLMDGEARLGAAKAVQAGWVGVVDGDAAAHDLCRILRVPGSHNFKYDPPRVVTWLRSELGRTYPLPALTAHLPPIKVKTVEPVRQVAPLGVRSIDEFNRATDVRDLLRRRGYEERGRHRMVSPWSGSKRDGVSIDDTTNRVFVHTGGDPLADGYWKRPFDVVRLLDFDGDFKRALEAVREGRV